MLFFKSKRIKASSIILRGVLSFIVVTWELLIENMFYFLEVDLCLEFLWLQHRLLSELWISDDRASVFYCSNYTTLNDIFLSIFLFIDTVLFDKILYLKELLGPFLSDESVLVLIEDAFNELFLLFYELDIFELVSCVSYYSGSISWMDIFEYVY